LRVSIENLEIQVLKDTKVRLTASFGIASFPENGSSLDDLLVAADENLYKAKRLGKNQIA